MVSGSHWTILKSGVGSLSWKHLGQKLRASEAMDRQPQAVRFLSQQLLQEAQIYPGGKLLLGYWKTVDLKHVCCSLTVVKHGKKREEAALVLGGATRRGALRARKCVMSGEFGLSHRRVGDMPNCFYWERSSRRAVSRHWKEWCLKVWGRGWALGYMNRRVKELPCCASPPDNFWLLS